MACWPLTAAASAASAAAVVVVVILRVVLRPIVHHLTRLPSLVDDLLLPHQSYTIPKLNESLQENPLHRAATSFLSSLPSVHDSAHSLLLSSPPSPYYLQLSPLHPVRDVFLGAPISWTLLRDQSLLLRLRRSDRRRVLRPYLQHIQSVADELHLTSSSVRLFTNASPASSFSGAGRLWHPIPFTHPSTFDSLTMDSDLKSRVVFDLDSFLKNKSYYNRLGRVWKRTYLLHGAAGTGKSSFVAAMARYLRYDVYELDLSLLREGSSTELRTLLLQTSPRSVVVVEDLDRHLQALPELLSLVDGLFSCCGEERLMVFTIRGDVNVDPALLRPGRVDVHLHFPLCDFSAFKAMAGSYLGLKDHKLYPTVEEIFQSGVAISPAEIGEIMIANRGSPSRAIKTVINALQHSTAEATAKRLGGYRRTTAASEEEDERGANDGGTSVLGSNGAINKEIRKLYGLIRRGSRREVPVCGGGAAPFPPPLPLTCVSPAKHSQELSST